MPTYVIPPAGVSAASYFDPLTFVDPATPPIILGDDIDPETGELRSILSGIHPVDSAVIVAVRTVRGSGAAVQDVGHRLGDIKKVDDSTAKAIEQEFRRALQPLVDTRDIRIDKIEIEADPDTDSGSSFLAYTNLQAMTARTVKL